MPDSDSFKLEGGCHCKAIRYRVEGEAITHALCHCADCRLCAGAPMVGWSMFPASSVIVTKGQPKVYVCSDEVKRHFCGDCGTGLFYFNQKILPGIVDIQSGTFDNPEAAPPQAHIQVAERISWMRMVHELPEFDRYPPQS